jgi:excisionase family DNA binding protein
MARADKKIRIFSALEVANICGVVNQTAINWIKNGYIKAFTTPGGQYRVYAEDLADFLHQKGMRMPPELQKILEEQMAIDIILIVDDDKDVNMALRRGLEAYDPDLTIYQAYDGFDAGKLAIEKKPHLAILDINLPGVDGFKLCKTFKEDESFNCPFVLASSGMDNQETIDRIMAAGADGFLPKPLHIEDLVQKIEELSRTRRKRNVQ